MTSNSILERFSLEGRTAVVVGGAGQIGRATCRALAELGAAIAVVDLEGPGLDEAVSGLAAIGASVAGFGTDITDPDSVADTKGQVLRRFDDFAVLVNHAHYKGDPRHLRPGHDFFARFEDYPLTIWKETLDVNLTGLFLTCQHFGAHLAERGAGAVVNTSSTYGLVSPQHHMYGDSGINSPIAYATTKAAILNFSRYLATYWANDGVRVNCISPGGVANEGQSDEFVAAYTDRTPLGRMAAPEDYQGALAFLCSDASSYMTGANLVVDGGWTAW